MMRIGWLFMLLVLVGGCGKQAGTDAGSATPPKKTLQAAVCPTSPPNCFQHNASYAGIDVEILGAFCHARGYSF